MSFDFERKQRIAIIGGGPGGYEAALSAAQLGAEVTLVENTGVGGAAVLTDVVPSKTLIATADAAQAIDAAGDLGVQFYAKGAEDKPLKPETAINLLAVNKRILALAGQQSEDMREQLLEAGVNVVSGHGRMKGDNAVVISTGPDGTDFDQIEADTIVISTGSTPRELPAAKPDGKRILTWKQVYDLPAVPEHIIVVGSGVTGAEFASAYMNLGAKVTLVSSREQVLPGEDPDAAAVLEKVFTRGGMTLLARSRAEKVENTGDGVVVTLANGDEITGSHCLVAVGSTPNTEDIGLEEAGVQLADTGRIMVNRVGRTSIPNVYAVGDCTNLMPLASVASMLGRTAVFHAMGDAVIPFANNKIAANIFTSPEIATVGWTTGEDAVEYKLPIAANARAKMMSVRDGFVKLYARKGSGTVVGGVVVGPKASELIYPISIAVDRRLTVDQLARVFTTYPSLSGAINDAARAMHGINERGF
ncbi:MULTISPECIES: NAD(P)H-quinone dehydrogenase [unclassified Microbacterium]|uniref:NAD(P)H-quinone dehydrogenase n=1 Tax=unclassified Microbacterium TaxID=2609290 RepID=UPI00097ED40A|nr:NAD(P)H-quinone dehydrogenase [Microbacterium sp. JB110]RCS61421.1 NAD(P)H-quinone dehydrogenase [Microbacterium sp. JB110]SJM65403.1 Dihydrolipoamide dehydrogenase [Frigoribacterium sp. JB110]